MLKDFIEKILFLSITTATSTEKDHRDVYFLFIFVYLLGMAYNVPSVSGVPRRGIWAEVRSTGARYALLYAPDRDKGAIATEES